MSETEERPEWLPEKFKTPEDLAKAYSELERRLGSQGSSQPAGSTQGSAGPLGFAQGSEGLERLLAAAEAEFSEAGQISEQTMAALERSGLPKKHVQQFLNYRGAYQQQALDRIYSSVGGEENYARMVAWGQANLSPEQQETFNRVVSSGDMGAIEMAVSGLHAQYRGNTSQEPNLVRGQQVASKLGPEPFTSRAAWLEAINDPRYQKDPSYRKEVQDRAASTQEIRAMTGQHAGGGNVMATQIREFKEG